VIQSFTKGTEELKPWFVNVNTSQDYGNTERSDRSNIIMMMNRLIDAVDPGVILLLFVYLLIIYEHLAT